MKVKGINDAYFVEIEKNGKDKVSITVGDFNFNMRGVVITKKDFEKIVKDILK